MCILGVCIYMVDRNIYYLGNSDLPKIIPMMEQVVLLKDYYYNKNKESRNKLIVHNTRAVSKIVNKYIGGYDSEELFSIGIDGLIKAVDKFDVSKYSDCDDDKMGKSWIKFMNTCIDNNIKMFFRKHNKVCKTEEAIMDKVIVGKDDVESRATVGEMFIDERIDYNPEDKIEKKEILNKIKDLFETILEDDEKKILLAHCGFVTGKKMTEREIKEYYGFSYCRSYINRKKNRALKKLRKKLIQYK